MGEGSGSEPFRRDNGVLREADASSRSMVCAWTMFVFGRPAFPEYEGDSIEVSGVPLVVGI